MPRNHTSDLVLVVDDIPTNLKVLSKLLSHQGFEVMVAVDGMSALQQVAETPPDLILLDVMMPEMNGFEICQRLKTSPLTSNIPVIFMTALSDPMDKVRGLNLGAVDYITKPFQNEELLARVQIHLNLRHLTQMLEEQVMLLGQEIRDRRAAEIALQQANERLHRQATLDGLTQVANRRKFDECLLQEWKRLTREGAPIGLVMCDIDYFKRYNDYYGHPAGDDCLKQVAQGIARVMRRPADLVARYGGEEFAIVLPNTSLEGLQRVTDALLLEIRNLRIPHAGSDVDQYVTLSVGATSFVPDPDALVESLIARADGALYTAKARGRNCAIIL